MVVSVLFFFFFKQKTAYEMRISDWSSDVCSSDLVTATVMIVLHFNKATKPSYVRVASFRSPFDTIVYFLPCPENRGLFNHMCPAPQAHARQRIAIRIN